MDPLTQATLGAAAAQVSRPRRFVAASGAGAAGGFLPDADVLIRSSSDPLLFLEYHRHFTHSLAFIPIGGAVTALCCAKLSRGRVGFRELFLPATLGWATHGLLDSCTSYGTYLYWPFSDERVAWHLVSIVDPLFTVPLLAGVIWAIRRRSVRIARASLAVALAYIGFCAFQLHRAESIHAGVMAERGHASRGVAVKPSMGNNIVFRAFYEYDGAYYAD
ncbi:MAG: metal-dependent hydrolase, partial [Myxococcota bacterium]|nr:metal-dependent hydrolase [Myxococcota bacterium]